MEKKHYIIGIVGPIAAGKQVVADYLVKKYGFIEFSLSTVIHLELEKRGVKDLSRTVLQDVGNELRSKYGCDILARKAIEIFNHQKRSTIISGIRNLAEIKYLKKNPNFVLIAVLADKKIRFKRLLLRAKPWDPKTYKKFLKINDRDLGIGEVNTGQQVALCIDEADYKINNNTNLEKLYLKIEKMLQQMKKSGFKF